MQFQGFRNVGNAFGEAISKRPRTLKGDFASFIVFPIQFIAVCAVFAVLLLAWAHAKPIMTYTSNAFGLPLTGTAIIGVNGINQTTAFNIGDQIYNFDPYLAFIFYFILMTACLSTLFLSPNPIAWFIGVLFSPFIYWIGAYVGNFAYAIFSQPIFATVTPFMSNVIYIMSQIQDITIIFFVLYIICLSIRVYFYNPSKSNQESAEFAAAMARRMT